MSFDNIRFVFFFFFGEVIAEFFNHSLCAKGYHDGIHRMVGMGLTVFAVQSPLMAKGRGKLAASDLNA